VWPRLRSAVLRTIRSKSACSLHVDLDERCGTALLVERGTEAPPRPQQADAERRWLEAEHAGRLRRGKVFPGDEQERLAVCGRERAESGV
jgi:hypothetical protein